MPVYVEVPIWLLLMAGIVVLIAEWTRRCDRKAIEWDQLTDSQRFNRTQGRLDKAIIATLVFILICTAIQALAIIAPLT